MPSLYDLKFFLSKRENLPLAGEELKLYEVIIFYAMGEEKECPKLEQLEMTLDFIPAQSICNELELDGFKITPENSNSCVLQWQRCLTTSVT